MAFFDGEALPETRSLRNDLLDLSDELTQALEDLRTAGKNEAQKDNAMRIAKAKAFLLAQGKNKEEREARADPNWQKERLEARLAESEKETCLEVVRSLRAQMSALQALVYANRAEGEATKYNQIQTT
jgi:hypothetical protein